MKKNLLSRPAAALMAWITVLGIVLGAVSLAEAAPARPLYRKAAPPTAPVSNNDSDLGYSQKRNTPPPRRSVPINRGPLGVEHNWYLFLGVDAGVATYSAFNSATEANRSGVDAGVRALLAHYWQDWVVDGGLGWHFIQNSATNPDGRRASVVTRGVYLDLSPRYRLDRHWQLGLEGELWLSPDNGLNRDIFLDPQPTNTGFFLGPQVLYEWSGRTMDQKFRFGARFLHGMNVDTRSVNVIQAFFQFGFNIFGGGHSEEVRNPRLEQVNESDLDRANEYVPPVLEAAPVIVPAATPWPEPEVMSTPEPLPVATATPTPMPPPKMVERAPRLPKGQVILTLDTYDLPFEFDSAKLPKANQDRLKKIGAFLGKHQDKWKSLNVGGHTDERGSNPYNDKLSMLRAQAVRDYLIEGGSPSARVKAVGYGERKPKDKHHNEAAWAKNRRVELLFFGVKDVKIIHQATE